MPTLTDIRALRRTAYGRVAKTAAVAAAVAIGACLYGLADPAAAKWMPRCLFKCLTGYDCPGCGMQRALHAVLNGDIGAAWTFNPFLFFLVPAAIMYVSAECGIIKNTCLRKAILSRAAATGLLAATAAWWIVRNII